MQRALRSNRCKKLPTTQKQCHNTHARNPHKLEKHQQAHAQQLSCAQHASKQTGMRTKNSIGAGVYTIKSSMTNVAAQKSWQRQQQNSAHAYVRHGLKSVRVPSCQSSKSSIGQAIRTSSTHKDHTKDVDISSVLNQVSVTTKLLPSRMAASATRNDNIQAAQGHN